MIHCRSTATERSKSKIFQQLCLNYKPLTKSRERKVILLRKSILGIRQHLRMKGRHATTNHTKTIKFFDVARNPCQRHCVEHWNRAEFDEYCLLMDKKSAKLKQDVDERIKLNDELFGKLNTSTEESENKIA